MKGISNLVSRRDCNNVPGYKEERMSDLEYDR
jgi:hypothetical protein